MILQLTRHQKGTLNVSGMHVLGCDGMNMGMIKWPNKGICIGSEADHTQMMLCKTNMTTACDAGSSAKECRCRACFAFVTNEMVVTGRALLLNYCHGTYNSQLQSLQIMSCTVVPTIVCWKSSSPGKQIDNPLETSLHMM